MTDGISQTHPKCTSLPCISTLTHSYFPHISLPSPTSNTVYFSLPCLPFTFKLYRLLSSLPFTVLTFRSPPILPLSLFASGVTHPSFTVTPLRFGNHHDVPEGDHGSGSRRCVLAAPSHDIWGHSWPRHKLLNFCPLSSSGIRLCIQNILGASFRSFSFCHRSGQTKCRAGCNVADPNSYVIAKGFKVFISYLEYYSVCQFASFPSCWCWSSPQLQTPARVFSHPFSAGDVGFIRLSRFAYLHELCTMSLGDIGNSPWRLGETLLYSSYWDGDVFRRSAERVVKCRFGSYFCATNAAHQVRWGCSQRRPAEKSLWLGARASEDEKETKVKTRQR